MKALTRVLPAAAAALAVAAFAAPAASAATTPAASHGVSGGAVLTMTGDATTAERSAEAASPAVRAVLETELGGGVR